MATKPFTDSTSGIPQENLPFLRAYVARTIENLVGVLDALDTCVDLEDSDPLELEEDACAAGDDGNRVHGQQDYEAGDPDDAEDDNEDCCVVLDKDGELSLSSSEDVNQEHWRYAGNCDIEADDCDREDDDPAESNGDLEACNDDREGENERWRKTAKDRQLITDVKQYFRTPAGRRIYREEKQAIKRFILEKAND